MKSFAYDISVVVPLFNEEDSIEELTSWIARVMQENGLRFELIFVDDGSVDNSWPIIEGIKSKYPQIRAIRFNRNYGKSAALHAGFQACEGEVVITMDGDLQDSPDEIPGLYHLIKHQHYDLVSGWKKKRHDPLNKTIPSKFFNAVTSKISGINLHDFNCGLKAYKLEVVRNIEVYGEMHRYLPYIAKMNGFGRITEKEVLHRPRKYGKTKFGFERFIYGFLDLLSITFVSKFKKRPMHFFGGLGSFSFLAGLLITLYVIGKKLWKIYHGLPHREVVDQPLFFLALVALVVGVQLFLSGFIGEMMTLNSDKKHDYIILDRIEKEEQGSYSPVDR